MMTLLYTLILTLVFLPVIYILVKRQVLKGIAPDCSGIEHELAKKVEILEETLDENRLLIEASIDAIITANEEGQISGWNSASERIFGYTKEEAIGQPLNILIPERYRSKHRDGFMRYIKTGEVKVMGRITELEALKKDGTIIQAEISLSAHHSDAAHTMTAIIRDISARKEAQDRMAHEIDVTKNLLGLVDAIAKTVDIDNLLRQIASSVQGSMECDYTLTYLWDRELAHFRAIESKGLSHEKLHLFRMEALTEELPVVKEAIEKGGFTVQVMTGESPDPAIEATKKFYSWADDLHTAVVVPLLGRRAYLGLIVCLYRKTNPKAMSGLKTRETELLRGISRHVSVVLEDARLYKDSLNHAMELSHKIETIQVMQEIDRSILSALESQEIMETAASMISRIISCDRATVAIADKEKKQFAYAAGFGIKVLPKGSFIAFKDTMGTDVMESCMSEYMADIHQLDDLPFFEKTLKEEGFSSHIRVPIIVKGEGKGFLCVGSKRVSAFTPEDMSTLETLASQVGVALENSRLLKDIEELFMGTVRTLSEAIDAKSSWTQGHSERMTRLSVKIGKELGLAEDELKKLELAGLLHDLGKIGTYEAILDKPSGLTDGEAEMVHSHPLDAAKILAPIKQLSEIVPSIKAHHEYFNGHGYPEGLKGRAIPFLARILAVADAVDAMGADRPYRKGMPIEDILSELKRCSGSQLDPEVVEAFLRVQKSQPLF